MGYPQQGIPLAGATHAPNIYPSRVARHQAQTDTNSIPRALQRLQSIVRRLKDPETRNSPGWNAERISIGFELIDLVCWIFPETTAMSDDPAMELMIAFAEVAERDHEIERLRRQLAITQQFVPEACKTLLDAELQKGASNGE